MNPHSVLHFSLFVAVAISGISCTTARKKDSTSAAATDLGPLLSPLSALQPTQEEKIASLKAIAASPNASLPPHLASASNESEEIGTTPEEELAPAAPSTEDGETTGPDLAGSSTIPESWRNPGLNPDEVNPGDIFSENEGPALHKLMSLIDELPAPERNALLNQFTTSKSARVPVTISRAEIAELEKTASPDSPLPTRSVALDFRTETHTLDEDRHAALLDGIGRKESSGAITTEARLERLNKQIRVVKNRLRSGEKLHIVTAVAESSMIHATYPGAPVGKRDADLIRNALAGLYPHLRSLDAKKGSEDIEITGNPRILWEFDTRELKLAGEKLVIDGISVGRL